MTRILLLTGDRRAGRRIAGPLRDDGHAVELESRPDHWAHRENEIEPDLTILTRDAREAALRPRPETQTFQPPILLLVPEGSWPSDEFLPDRFIDRMQMPAEPRELAGRADALLRLADALRDDETARRRAARRSHPAWRVSAERLWRTLRSRVPRWRKPIGPYMEVATGVARWADRRDAFEPGHADRVAAICALIGQGLGMSEERIAGVLRAALLHDIGKAGLPASLLHQRGPLEDLQRHRMQRHPEIGARILQQLDGDHRVEDAVRFHHERPDGHGYYGRQALQTPREAHILAVAEVFDAMTSSRLQRRVGRAEALRRMQDWKGERFDPDCVEALADAIKPRRNPAWPVPPTP